MPQISVIVPVYKVEPYLRECVDSILAQTFTDFELILVDDGSPDNCGAICDEYAVKDSRVRVIHQENQGLSGARNSGLDVAEGDYITFVDSDDCVDLRYLECLYSEVEAGAEVAICRHSEFSDCGTLVPYTGEATALFFERKEALLALYNGNSMMSINAWGKLFSRKLLGEIRFPLGRLHEDQAFTPYILYSAIKIISCDAILYHYRVNPASITRNAFSLKRYDDLWAIDSCIEFFREKGEWKIAEAAQNRRHRLLCTYALYAHGAGVAVPEQYRIPLTKALRYLRKNVSADKYQYCLAQLNPKLVILDAYLRKIESIFTAK